MAGSIEEALLEHALPRLSGRQLEALEQIACIDRTLEPVADSIVSVVREVIALRALLEVTQADAQRYKQDHLNACGTIAEMHAAAVGETVGPNRGVVEDVADLRTDWMRASNDLLQQDARIGELEYTVKCLGEIALSLCSGHDDVERARINALLKVTNAPQTAPAR